jgi:hypothetical protein
MLKIKVFNASKAELLDDFNSNAFDQNALWKKIYEHEYGMFGGVPFSAMLGDYEFTRSSQDIKLLEHMSTVAAGAHAPFLSAASPDLLDLGDYTELNEPTSLGEKFESTTFANWNAFRQTEDSRYVALALPRMLLREPYGKDTIPVNAFNYEEGIDGKTHGNYLWGNAAYALGSKVTQAFAKYNWCATIRGVESGGLVQHLPVHNFKTDSGNTVMKCPTEVQIPDRREKELADLGFAPLVHQKGMPNAAFCNGERESVVPDPVHLRRLAVRTLPESHRAGQDRRIHVTERSAELPSELDLELSPGHGRRTVRGQGQAPSPRRADRSIRNPGQAGRVSGDGIFAPALSTRGVAGIHASRRGVAAASRIVAYSGPERTAGRLVQHHFPGKGGGRDGVRCIHQDSRRRWGE